MLVLTRKPGEEIYFADDIKITVLKVRGDSVRIGIDAAKDIPVVRGEIRHRGCDGSVLEAGGPVFDAVDDGVLSH